MRRHALHALLLASAVLFAVAAPAGAHVEIDPPEAVAGSTTTLTFAFHHGGEGGSATTGLDVQLPAGVTVVDVPEVAGWTSSVDEEAGVVRWRGGSVPDGTEGRFPLVVELPEATGELLFPTVQITESGELAWIGDDEGDSESANPAPRVTVVAEAAGATTTTADSTTTTEPPPTTNDLPDTALEAETRDDGGGSLTPWLVGAGVAALLTVLIGGAVLQRRSP